NRARNGAQSADQGEHGDLNRQFEREGRGRVDEGQVGNVEGADDAGEHGRDHRGPDLDLGGGNADRPGGVLALADGDQVMAHARLAHKPRGPHHHDVQEEGDIDVVDLFTKDDPGPAYVQGDADAARAAGPAFFVDDQQ